MGWLVDELKWTADEDEIARGSFIRGKRGGKEGKPRRGRIRLERSEVPRTSHQNTR